MNTLLSYKFDKREVFQGADIEIEFSLDVEKSSVTDISIHVVVKADNLGTIKYSEISYNSADNKYTALIPASYTKNAIGDMFLYIEVKYSKNGNPRVYRNRINPFIVEKFNV